MGDQWDEAEYSDGLYVTEGDGSVKTAPEPPGLFLQWEEEETEVAKKIGRQAIESDEIAVDGREDLVVRNILPALDLEPGGDNGWGGDKQEWAQHWTPDANLGRFNEAYEIDSDGRAEGKIFAFYGVSFSPLKAVAEWARFTAPDSESVYAERIFDVGRFPSPEYTRMMFTTPVVFGPNESGTIEHHLGDTGLERVEYHGWVAEPVGVTYENPLNPPPVEGYDDGS